MNIPHPDNLEHTENLSSIALLEAQGFEGPDASLEISLFEYGIAWRVMETETLFIYAIKWEGMDDEATRFDRASLKTTLILIRNGIGLRIGIKKSLDILALVRRILMSLLLPAKFRT